MLTACPSSLAAGKTVTPVIQAYEHSMENVWVCLCVCALSGDYDSVWWEGRGALLTLPEAAEMCGQSHTLLTMTSAWWELHNLNLEGHSLQGAKTLRQMTQWCSKGKKKRKKEEEVCGRVFFNYTHADLCTGGIKCGHSRQTMARQAWWCNCESPLTALPYVFNELK